MAHHFFAMNVSTAKIGSPGRNAPSSSPSRNDAWFAAMTACGNAARACSRPCTSTRYSRRNSDAHDALRQRTPQDPRSRHGYRNRARARTTQRVRPSSGRAPTSAAAPFTGGHGQQALMMLLAGDDARSRSRLALVLEDRIERHGEQAPSHRHADQVDQDAPAPGSARKAGRPTSFASPARPLLASGDRWQSTPSAPRTTARAAR